MTEPRYAGTTRRCDLCPKPPAWRLYRRNDGQVNYSCSVHTDVVLSLVHGGNCSVEIVVIRP